MAVQVVSFHCTLKNKLGRVIGTTFNQNVINDYQSETDSLAALVEEMRDLKKGEKRKIFLSAERAYGFYNPDLVIMRSYDEILMNKNEPVKVGEQVVFVAGGRQRIFRVIHVSPDSITLDGDDPLAGQDLIFEIEATEARDATEEELLANQTELRAAWQDSNTFH